jgi:hypothetical protein
VAGLDPAVGDGLGFLLEVSLSDRGLVGVCCWDVVLGREGLGSDTKGLIAGDLGMVDLERRKGIEAVGHHG